MFFNDGEKWDAALLKFAYLNMVKHKTQYWDAGYLKYVVFCYSAYLFLTLNYPYDLRHNTGTYNLE